MQKTNPAPSKRDLRIFAMIVSMGFLIIGLLIPLMRGHAAKPYLIWISIAITALGLLTPNLLITPRKCWIKIGNVLGKINSTILFTIIYFLIFMTIGWVFKVFGRDRLFTKFRNVDSTMVYKKEISPFSEPF